MKSLIVLTAFFLILLAVPSHATSALSVRSNWTGAGDGVYWDDQNNWSPNLINNRSAIFNVSSLSENRLTRQNVKGVIVNELIFNGDSGYESRVTGHGINLVGGVVSADTSRGVIYNNLKMLSSGSVRTSGTSRLFVHGMIKHAEQPVTLSAVGDSWQYYYSRVLGSGAITVSGDGLVYLLGNASLESKTYMRNGATISGEGSIKELVTERGTNFWPEGCIQTGDTTIRGTVTLQISARTPCDGYGKTISDGVVKLDGAKLNATLGGGYFAPYGARFVIISNTSSNQIEGAFNTLPEGKRIEIDGQMFMITYRGGTGRNEVQLIAKERI